MNKIKNKLKIILVLCITFLTILSAWATTISLADEPEKSSVTTNINSQSPDSLTEPTVLSKHAILMEQQSGQILLEYKSDEKAYPASTTKLITAILTLEKCNLTDEVVVNKKALLGIPRSYTTAALQADEHLTVDQLLHVLLIPSANDAANALAFHIAGSIEDFSVMMNEKAKEIGCENTHFVNPSGIHDDNHYSTAHDMALIGRYALKFDTIKSIAKELTYTLPPLPNGKERIFKPTNTLIMPKNQYFYEYATGLKTGYTDKSKSCIVATAEKDGKKLLCVILGGEKTEANKAQRELDCHTLFDYGFNNFKYENMCTANNILDKSTISSLPSKLKNADIAYADSLSLMVPVNTSSEIQYTFSDSVQLPIQKGTALGYATYTVYGKEYKINLLAANDVYPVKSSSINYVLLISFLALALVVFSTIKKKKYHKRESKYFKRSLY